MLRRLVRETGFRGRGAARLERQVRRAWHSLPAPKRKAVNPNDLLEIATGVSWREKEVEA